MRTEVHKKALPSLGCWGVLKGQPDWHARPPRRLSCSPLFTGDAGSGESEIRRWILENDLLEAIIALPNDLFYNTGIATYVWLLSNHKKADRKRKVQLIDATRMYAKMKSLGNKRVFMTQAQIEEVVKVYAGNVDQATFANEFVEPPRTATAAARRSLSRRASSPRFLTASSLATAR